MEDYNVISSLESIPLPTGMDVQAFDSLQKEREKHALDAPKAKESENPTAPTLGQTVPTLPSEMSYAELDAHITSEVKHTRKRLEELLPYLLEMRELLSRQGSRTDLRGAPARMTWQKWVESKKDILGSLRNVNRALNEATDKKPACPECGKKRGHLSSCPHYVAPEPKPLSALESKFVDASLQQHNALQDFYGGRTDAESALKSIVATIPAHDRLEEYCQRGSEAVEINKKLEEQEDYILKLGAEIACLNEENEALQQSVAESSDDPVSDEPTSRSERVTYKDWKNHKLPATHYKLRYFEDASRYFWDRYYYVASSRKQFVASDMCICLNWLRHSKC